MTNKPMLSVERELLPCPFCGSYPILPDGYGTQYEIECNGCGQAASSVQICDLMTLEERTADEFKDYRYGEEFIERAKLVAIDAWNNRVKPAAQHQIEPVAKLHAERLTGRDGEYGVTVEDSEWFNTCRLTGGIFNLYTEQSAPVASDIVHDRAYRDGLKRGFGLGENGKVEQYHKEFSAYQNGITCAEKDALAPVAVVMPERKNKADYSGYIEEFQSEAAGLYNSALDDVARLNGVKP